MRYRDIVEGSNHQNMEIYHWTTSENLIRILRSGELEKGTSHKIGGKDFEGVSLTRDGYLDLSNTYAVSGRRPWRIGLNYAKLKNRFKIVPIRDDYLRSKPRGNWAKQKSSLGPFGRQYENRIPHDEMEEFVLSSITPLSDYITSIAVEDRWIDLTTHPREIDADPDYHEEEFEFESIDYHLIWSLLSITNPDLFDTMVKYKKTNGWHPYHFDIDPVPVFVLHRNSHRVEPIESAYKWFMDQIKARAA